VAATLLSRFAVPVIYFLVARRGRAAELQREGALASSVRIAASPALRGCEPASVPPQEGRAVGVSR
jgi:hypothetical protein